MIHDLSRRALLRASAATTLAGMSIPYVHAGEENTIQVALIGCGGRGTGAAANALSTKSGPIKLVAMADVFPERLSSSFEALQESHSAQMDIPEDRKHIGFDGYKKAIDQLKPGDVAIMATPPAFRWVQFEYAIEKGVNVFMEKPITVDGPSTKKMLALGEKSIEKNLKVGVGLMCRHCDARAELYKRIKDGQIGEVLLLRAYRMAGPTAWGHMPRRPEGISELMYQIQKFHSFLWASGGAYSDFLIHNIDECCWMKDAWPVKAQGVGGRQYRGDAIDQNFDHYAVEYTFEDGTKLLLDGRTMEGCHNEFASYVHGSKAAGVISRSGHTPARCRISRNQNLGRSDTAWAFEGPEPNPYQLEWDHLIEAIRHDRPFNEVKRGAEASLVTAMGRMASHTGQVVTYEEMLACSHEFAPDVDKLTLDGPAPIKENPDGTYAQPQPGILKDREY